MKRIITITLLCLLVSCSQSNSIIRQDNYSSPGRTDIFNEENGFSELLKIINGSNTSYSLGLTAYGKAHFGDNKGVSILFENGTKLDRPYQNVSISATSSRDKFKYHTYISLSESEVNQLINSRIHTFKLCDTERTISKRKSELFRQQCGEIKRMK